MELGLGEPFFDPLESLLAHLPFSIPGVRGIEFGDGFRSASIPASQHNDLLLDAKRSTESNHCGGIKGGISNGNPLLLRVVFKPMASIPRPQVTHHFSEGRRLSLRVTGRHDLCFALRTPVVVEAAVAIALADLTLIRRQPCASDSLEAKEV